MSLLQQSFLRHHKSFLGRWCFFIRKKQKTKAQLVDGPGSIINSGQLRKLQQCRICCVTSSASQTHSSTYPNKGKRYQFNHQRELCFACLFFSFFCSRRNIGHLKKKAQIYIFPKESIRPACESRNCIHLQIRTLLHVRGQASWTAQDLVGFTVKPLLEKVYLDNMDDLKTHLFYPVI